MSAGIRASGRLVPQRRGLGRFRYPIEPQIEPARNVEALRSGRWRQSGPGPERLAEAVQAVARHGERLDPDVAAEQRGYVLGRGLGTPPGKWPGSSHGSARTG